MIKKNPLVLINCLTFNQESYIKETIEGFLMQKTDFPFIILIHDDASSDSTTKIISEYKEKYPDIIQTIIETENQYSKRDGSLDRIIDSAIAEINPKYVALCEGDDYWIDPNKLQKQIDFLESHPDYSTCATNSYYLFPNGKLLPSRHNTSTSRDTEIEEVIIKGGLFLTTATLVYRYSCAKVKPYVGKGLKIGDHPLQIWLATKGKIRILDDLTAVYRRNSMGSWTNRNKKIKNDYNERRKQLDDKLYLSKIMNEITENKYKTSFDKLDIVSTFRHNMHFSPYSQIKLFLKNPILIKQNNRIKTILYSFLPVFIKKRINLNL